MELPPQSSSSLSSSLSPYGITAAMSSVSGSSATRPALARRRSRPQRRAVSRKEAVTVRHAAVKSAEASEAVGEPLEGTPVRVDGARVTAIDEAQRALGKRVGNTWRRARTHSKFLSLSICVLRTYELSSSDTSSPKTLLPVQSGLRISRPHFSQCAPSLLLPPWQRNSSSSFL